MDTPLTIYKFAGFILNPAKRNLFQNGEEILLVNRDFEVLLLLIENRPQILSKEQIMKSVWDDISVEDGSIEKAISSLRKILGDNPYKPRFIKTVTKKGYVFIHDVAEITENAASTHFEKPVFQKSFSRHSAYILSVSLLYGLLFWIALLLEVAYQFDRFGTDALWLGFPLVLWIAATTFTGLSWTRNLVRQEKRNALFVGLTFFVIGTILMLSAMSYFLPTEPITQASFQTQTAFAAFLKNSLIYFLPLGVIFILIPFHFICVQQSEIPKDFSFPGNTELSLLSKGAIDLRPSLLFGLWLVTAGYSIFSTFHLLDNLLPGRYHNLFVTLIFLRFFVYFSLGLICLIWYNSQRIVSIFQGHLKFNKNQQNAENFNLNTNVFP